MNLEKMSDEFIPTPYIRFTVWNHRNDDDTYHSKDSISVMSALHQFRNYLPVEIKFFARIVVERSVSEVLIEEFGTTFGNTVFHLFGKVPFRNHTYHETDYFGCPYSGCLASCRYIVQVTCGSVCEEKEIIVINPVPHPLEDENHPQYLESKFYGHWEFDVFVDKTLYFASDSINVVLDLKTFRYQLKGVKIEFVIQTLRKVDELFVPVGERLVDCIVKSFEFPRPWEIPVRPRSYRSAVVIDLARFPLPPTCMNVYDRSQIKYMLKFHLLEEIDLEMEATELVGTEVTIYPCVY